MFQTFINAFKIKEIRKKLLITLVLTPAMPLSWLLLTKVLFREQIQKIAGGREW